MSAYRVELSGCDDTTYLDLDLTEDEAGFLHKIEALSAAESTCGCMPVLTIRAVKES